jgi:hypothetical protein
MYPYKWVRKIVIKQVTTNPLYVWENTHIVRNWKQIKILSAIKLTKVGREAGSFLHGRLKNTPRQPFQGPLYML